MYRQRAKTRQEVEGSRLNYLELWREEFSAQVPTWRGSGHQLQVNSILKGTILTSEMNFLSHLPMV